MMNVLLGGEESAKEEILGRTDGGKHGLGGVWYACINSEKQLVFLLPTQK